ncbi:MAG: SET domain-containing protein [Verrucomicrobia bacterium]|nr:SET domain-containing protein [Verrucomicrobiota bacterium]
MNISLSFPAPPMWDTLFYPYPARPIARSLPIPVVIDSSDSESPLDEDSPSLSPKPVDLPAPPARDIEGDATIRVRHRIGTNPHPTPMLPRRSARLLGKRARVETPPPPISANVEMEILQRPLPRIITISSGLIGAPTVEWRPSEEETHPPLGVDIPSPFRGGVEYTESLWAYTRERIVPRSQSLTPLPSLALGLYFVDREIGWGLYTLQDIPRGTPIGLYAGNWFPRETAGNIRNKDYFYSFPSGSAVDANIARGLAAYILHAPTKLPATLRHREVAIANTEFINQFHTCRDGSKRTVALVFAKQFIPRDTPLFVDYGDEYWPSLGITPSHFHPTTGAPLPASV